MAAGVIGSLAVSVVARVQKFQKDMRSAGGSVRQMANTARQAGSVSSSVTPALARMAGRGGYAGVGLAALYAANKITSLNDEQARSIDLIGKTSSKLGIQAERLQQLQYAGDLSGVSTNTMNMALQRMTRRVAEAAQGTGEAKDAIAQLNLSAEALAALSPDKQFAAITNEFAKIESHGEKVRLAFKIFDSEGVGLVNTMAGGLEGLNKVIAEANGTGSIITEKQVKEVEALNDATARLGKAWDGVLMPTKLWLTEWKSSRLNTFAGDLESISRVLNGVDASTRETIINQRELNSVFDAQAAIRAKQAKAEAERKAARKKEFEDLEKTIAAQKEALETELARVKLQGSTLGLSPEQARIAELREKFADNAINSETADALIKELEVAEKLRKEHERIEEVKRQGQVAAQQRADDAKTLIDSLKTDKQRLVEEVNRIQGFRDAGLINSGQHMAAIKSLQASLGPETTSGRLSGVMREGSREARSLELRGNREAKEDEVAKNTSDMKDLLQGILDNLETDAFVESAAGEVKPWA